MCEHENWFYGVQSELNNLKWDEKLQVWKKNFSIPALQKIIHVNYSAKNQNYVIMKSQKYIHYFWLYVYLKAFNPSSWIRNLKTMLKKVKIL